MYLSVTSGIVFTYQTFHIENQSHARLKEKSIWKKWLFNQISIDFRFREAYSWPAIAAHAKFEQYDWLRIINLYKDWNDSQSSLSTDILSLELHTETVFVNLNSNLLDWLIIQTVERLKDWNFQSFELRECACSYICTRKVRNTIQHDQFFCKLQFRCLHYLNKLNNFLKWKRSGMR